MENASKALIIAGAILLAILIIGLGMMVFNNVRGRAGDTSAIDEISVQQFNSKFEPYLGYGISGTRVNALLETVARHNRSHSDDASLQVTICLGSNIVAGSTNSPDPNIILGYKSKIGAAKGYHVYAGTVSGEIPYDPNSGYLRWITIREGN